MHETVHGSPVSPSGDIEQGLYTQSYQSGVEAGKLEARAEFSENLNRLMRDYAGMQLYHQLAEQGALSLPKVSRRSNGNVRISAGGTLASIGGETLKLVVSPKFKANSPVAYR